MVFYSFKIFWAGSRLNYFESATHIGAWRHLKSRALSDTVAQQWRAQGGGGAWGRRRKASNWGSRAFSDTVAQQWRAQGGGAWGGRRRASNWGSRAFSDTVTQQWRTQGGGAYEVPPPPMIPKIQILCAGHGHLPLIPRSRRMVAMTWASLGMAGASPGFFSTASDDIFANNFTFW